MQQQQTRGTSGTRGSRAKRKQCQDAAEKTNKKRTGYAARTLRVSERNKQTATETETCICKIQKHIDTHSHTQIQAYTDRVVESQTQSLASERPKRTELWSIMETEVEEAEEEKTGRREEWKSSGNAVEATIDR